MEETIFLKRFPDSGHYIMIQIGRTCYSGQSIGISIAKVVPFTSESFSYRLHLNLYATKLQALKKGFKERVFVAVNKTIWALYRDTSIMQRFGWFL